MDQLDTTQATLTKGQPLLAQSFKFGIDGLKDALNQLAAGVVGEYQFPSSASDGVVLYGLGKTGTVIDSGYLLFDGEIYFVTGDDTAGYSGVAAIQEDFSYSGTLDPITFSDGTTGNVHQQRRLMIADNAGAGPFLTAYTDLVFKLKKRVLDVGIWNMDITATRNVAHVMDSTRIRSVEVWIKHDTTGEVFPLTYNTAGTPAGYFTYDGTNIIMSRLGGGLFDGTDFDSVASSRGYIVITWQ